MERNVSFIIFSQTSSFRVHKIHQCRSTQYKDQIKYEIEKHVDDKHKTL